MSKKIRNTNFITPNELSERIGITDNSVRNWVKSGFIKGTKVKGRFYIPLEEAERVESLILSSTGITENYSNLTKYPTNDLSMSEGKDMYIANSSRLRG